MTQETKNYIITQLNNIVERYSLRPLVNQLKASGHSFRKIEFQKYDAIKSDMELFHSLCNESYLIQNVSKAYENMINTALKYALLDVIILFVNNVHSNKDQKEFLKLFEPDSNGEMPFIFWCEISGNTISIHISSDLYFGLAFNWFISESEKRVIIFNDGNLENLKEYCRCTPFAIYLQEKKPFDFDFVKNSVSDLLKIAKETNEKIRALVKEENEKIDKANIYSISGLHEFWA